MTDNRDLKIEYHAPEELTPYKNNARAHKDLDIKAIRKSIQDFGFNDPIGIWSDDMIIVEGHGRQLAAIAEGLDLVPCIRLDHLTEEQCRAYALAHNKTAELSSWNFEALNMERAGIKHFDMTALGFEPVTNVSRSPEPDEPEEEDPWDDIDRAEKHYGVPYQGNKSRIADIIIEILPAGNRLVDLFGGGGP